MANHYDYGYGDLGNKLFELFLSKSPKLEEAEELIRQGADVNVIGRDDYENILSDILSNSRWSTHDDFGDAPYGNCQQAGPSMCETIRFFLDHGFDVTKRDGCFGAQCLWALTLSSFDRQIIEATKILLDAGAKNRTISPTSTNPDETPWSFIAMEGSYQSTCEHSHSLGNIYEAVYQIYQALEDGRPYKGIDSYEIAVGKKIQKVLAEQNADRPILFPLSLPEFKKNNCFSQPLYFVYDDGVLISTQYADFWTDTILPNVDLVDVSEHFDGIVGNTIQQFTFDHRAVVKGTTHYGQPIVTIEMDSGDRVRFSINFGEVSEENRAAYYELLKREW